MKKIILSIAIIVGFSIGAFAITGSELKSAGTETNVNSFKTNYESNKTNQVDASTTSQLDFDNQDSDYRDNFNREHYVFMTSCGATATVSCDRCNLSDAEKLKIYDTLEATLC